MQQVFHNLAILCVRSNHLAGFLDGLIQCHRQGKCLAQPMNLDKGEVGVKITAKVEDPYWILDTVEFKTAWHPIGI
jgi:hypothetical protein